MKQTSSDGRARSAQRSGNGPRVADVRKAAAARTLRRGQQDVGPSSRRSSLRTSIVNDSIEEYGFERPERLD